METIFQQATVKQSEYRYNHFIYKEDKNRQEISASYLDLFTPNHVSSILQDTAGINIHFDKAIIEELFDKRLTGDVVKLWEFNTYAATDSSPCISFDGTVYVRGDNGRIHAISSNGKEKWRFKTGSIIHGSPCLGPDGILYIGNDEGRICAVKPSIIALKKNGINEDNIDAGNLDPRITFNEEWVMIGNTKVNITK